MATLLAMTDTRRLGKTLCIFLPNTPSRPFREIVNNKETNSPREPVMEGIIKHMIGPTGKIKSATIVTKKTIHLLIVQKISRKKPTTTKSPSPEKRVNTVLKPVQRDEEG